MRGRVLILRLECVCKCLDRVEESLLQTLEAECIVDRERGLMSDSLEQSHLPLGKLVVAKGRGPCNDAPHAATLQTERSHRGGDTSVQDRRTGELRHAGTDGKGFCKACKLSGNLRLEPAALHQLQPLTVESVGRLWDGLAGIEITEPHHGVG